MHAEIILTHDPVASPQDWAVPASADTGSLVEFHGIVREDEAGEKIAGLHYEAYAAMVEKVMREKIVLLAEKHPCQAVRVVHRLGFVPVGESAIYVGIRSRHRGEGFRFLADFMDEFKRDVPIWKGV